MRYVHIISPHFIVLLTCLIPINIVVISSVGDGATKIYLPLSVAEFGSSPNRQVGGSEGRGLPITKPRGPFGFLSCWKCHPQLKDISQYHYLL